MALLLQGGGYGGTGSFLESSAGFTALPPISDRVVLRL